MVPPKNKGGGNIPDQHLSKKEIKTLNDNIPTIAVNESAVRAYVRTFDPPKRRRATELCEQGIAAWREQNANNVTAEATSSQIQGQFTAEITSEQLAAADELLPEGVAQDHVVEATPDQHLTTTRRSTVPSDNTVVITSDTVKTPIGNEGSSATTGIGSVELVEENVQLTMPIGNQSQTPQDLKDQLRQINIQDTEYPLRKGFRTPSSEVLTNHFEINIDAKAELFEYQTIGIPADVTKRQRKPIVNTILQSVPFLRDNEAYVATDYNETIVAWTNINDAIPYSYVNAGSKDTLEGRDWRILDIENDHGPLHITLRFTRMVDVASLQRYVTSDPALNAWDYSTVCNALNIVISKCFDGEVVKIGANKFFVERTQQNLGAGASLCTMRGYLYSILPKMGKIILNVNAATSAFYQPILLSDYLNDTDTFGLPDKMRFIKGVRVYIDYERGDRDEKSRISGCNRPQARVKKVFEIGSQTVIQQQFDETYNKQDGTTGTRSTTISNYLKTKYQIDLQNTKLPAINLGGKYDKSWFAPELLRILPYQVFRHVVPDSLMADMHKVACRSPEMNRILIESEGIGKLLRSSQLPAPLTRCPILSIDPRMLQVPCHRLNNPQVQYDQGFAVAGANTGRWDLRSKRFLRGNSNAPFHFVFLISPDLVLQNITVNNYVRDFITQITSTGVGRAVEGSRIYLQSTRQNELDSALRSASALKIRPDVVILLLKAKSIPIYSTFKYLADCVYGLQSICMTEEKCLDARSVRKNRDGSVTGSLRGTPQYVGNIAMKANLKKGGVNHATELVQNVAKDTLVLGADVTHPSPGALSGAPSIAAVVGSLDGTGGKFVGELSLQIKDRKRDWYNQNKTIPLRILYYRDGVAETQYGDVKTKELKEIELAWNDFFDWRIQLNPSLSELKRPDFRLIAVIVTKRHYTRFYPFKPTDKMQGNENCKPGTLVDSCVTSPYHSDFFLQSHNGLLGTAKSAHYFILENSAKMSDAQIQDLTHGFCHSYVRATLGVSYASPAYYADRLCERGRAYLRDFYAPNPPTRDRWDKRKNALEKAARGGRPAAAKWPSVPQHKKTKAQKDAEKAEREAEKNDREKALEAVKKEVRKEIDRVWHTPAANPLCAAERDRLLKTMYWM